MSDQQRERTNTVYYDAKQNFGTPPKEASGGGGGDYDMGGLRKASGSERGGASSGIGKIGTAANDEALYERVHTERRPNHSYNSPILSSSQRPIRQQQQHITSSSTDRLPMTSVHPIRSPTSAASGPVLMAPMSSSYDYSIGSTAPPSAFRAQSGADEQRIMGNRWQHRQYQQHEDFRPGPRASSAANIDALFAQKKPRSQSSSGVIPPPSSRMGGSYSSNEQQQQQQQTTTNMMFSRRTEQPGTPIRHHIHQTHQPYQHHRDADFGVVGAYSTDASQRADQIMYGRGNHGSVRQHSNDYELDPRLNVTYPQFYVDDWKERHRETASPIPGGGGYPRSNALPRQSPSFSTANVIPSGRPRFGSGANSRHLYEEVPMSSSSPIPHNGYRSPAAGAGASGYGRNGGGGKETAILDDYDNVPSEFLADEQQQHRRGKGRDELSNADGESGIYQPGRYQPSEDAGSSSDEDDPEYLDLMERDSIINRYEKGPDAADVDPWENPNFEVYTMSDRFGFVHKKGDKKDEPTDLQKRRIVKELSREKKWLKMIELWKSGSKKMEDRIWKGIPEKLRIVVWPRLLGAERLSQNHRDVYKELLLRARLVSKDIKQIDLDINRTYRDHQAFRKRYDVKQKSLLNVLAAYSMYNTEVGYCQGMSQIAALFLMYLDEEDAFWSLHQLMVSPKHTMHGFFVPGFPKLSRFEEHFKRVLKKYKPRIYKYLEKQDIPYIYLTKWWFGCFLDRVPFSLALRLWDVFLIEGDPILIAMAFNIFKMHEKSIRKQSMETFMEFIQNDIAQNFGYSDDEVMHSLRETLSKLKSDRQHVPPPPRPEDLSEVPTKALGPILHKPMASIREEIHEIQSRRSRANSTGRSPHPKRKESARGASKGPPPVVQHKWNGNASSQDSIIDAKREVPFEIPGRYIAGSSPASDASYGARQNGHHSSSGGGLPPQNKRDPMATPTSRYSQSQSSSHHHHNSNPSRSGPGSVTPSTQRLRDERNGKMVTLSRASDSEGDVYSPDQQSQHRADDWNNQTQISTATSRITHTENNITRIDLSGDVSVI